MTSPDDKIGESAWDNGPPRIIEILNGDDRLGYVAVARTIRACDPDGVEIGKFETVEAARAAIVRQAYAGKPT